MRTLARWYICMERLHVHRGERSLGSGERLSSSNNDEILWEFLTAEGTSVSIK